MIHVTPQVGYKMSKKCVNIGGGLRQDHSKGPLEYKSCDWLRNKLWSKSDIYKMKLKKETIPHQHWFSCSTYLSNTNPWPYDDRPRHLKHKGHPN